MYTYITKYNKLVINMRKSGATHWLLHYTGIAIASVKCKSSNPETIWNKVFTHGEWLESNLVLVPELWFDMKNGG